MCDLPGWVLARIAAGRWEAAATIVLEVATLVEARSDSIAASAMDSDTCSRRVARSDPVRVIRPTKYAAYMQQSARSRPASVSRFCDQ